MTDTRSFPADSIRFGNYITNTPPPANSCAFFKPMAVIHPESIHEFNGATDHSAINARVALSQQAVGYFELAAATDDGKVDAGKDSKPTNPGDTKSDKAPESGPDKVDDKPKVRGRLDDDDFDIALPLSNFRKVTDDVSRSGRPLVDKGGLDEIMEKLHPGVDKNTQRKNTAIIELRDEDQQMDKPEITALNKSEVLAEENMCKTSTPPVEYHRFKMVSKNFQSPEKIDQVVTTIEQAVAAGKKVSLHCFHGSDRSGLVSAAYLLSADQNLKNDLKTDPEKAYKTVRERMIDDGCDPASYTALFQSLKQYVDWKHEQLNGKTGTDGQNPVPVTDAPLDAAGQTRIDSVAKKMFDDKRFATDPISVYKEQLKDVSKDYDPATNSAFYKALKQKYIDGPPEQKQEQKQKTGAIMWLPNVNLVA